MFAMQNISKFLERESLLCDTLDEISDDYSMCLGCCKVKCNDINKCYLLLGETLKGVPMFDLHTSCGMCGNDYLFCVDCCHGTLLSVAPGGAVVCFECLSESPKELRTTLRKRQRGDADFCEVAGSETPRPAKVARV